MFEIFLILIALFGTGFAGLWDLKTSDVPDSVIVTMIAVGLILHISHGFLTGDFSLLVNGLMYGGIFLAFGLIMYFTGQWGGGDGELLVSIGILLPTTTLVATMLPFSLSYFLNMIIIGAFYSIIYAIVLSLKNRKMLGQFISGLKKDKTTQLTMTTIIVLIFMSVYFNVSTLPIILILLLILTFFYKFAKIVEKGFYIKIPTSKLQAGDIIGENIPKLKIFKKYVRGLTKKEVAKIKKMKKYTIIRSGVRFGPVFFITLAATLLFGDIFLLLF